MSRYLVYQSVSALLGLVLIGAAAFKMVGTAAASIPLVGWTSSADFQVALIVAEFVLGAWLISALRPVAARWTAITVFSLFTAYIGFVTATGTSSCGCFGDIPVRPSATLVFDLLAVGLLLIGSPRRDTATPTASGRSALNAGLGILLSLILGGIVVAGIAVRAGSLGNALGRVW